MTRHLALVVALVVALVAGPGCDRVFSQRFVQLDASAGDGGADALDGPLGLVDAGPLPPCTSDGEELTLPVLADTYLDAAASHGGEPGLRVGQGRVLLLAFQTGNLQFTSARLTLTHPTLSRACGTAGACGQCPPDTGGMFQLFWARTDWNELEADRLHRTLTAAWEQPLAAGNNDRSGNLGSFTYTGPLQLDVTRPFYPTDRHADWPQDALGVLVAPESGASTIEALFASKDARDCGGVTVPGPTLKVICKRP